MSQVQETPVLSTGFDSDLHDQLIFTIGTDGCFVDAFIRGNIPFSHDLDAIPGLHCRDVLPVALVAEILQSLQAGYDTHAQEKVYCHPMSVNGTQHWFLFRFMPLRRQQGLALLLVSHLSAAAEQKIGSLQRESLLRASSEANEELLRNRNIIEAVSRGLRGLGNAVLADRCYLFENHWHAELGELVCNQRVEWVAEQASPQIDNPELQDFPYSLTGSFLAEMHSGLPFNCHVALMPEGPFKAILTMQEIVSILLLPIHVENEFWGFVGFDDCCRRRIWSDAEISVLASFATSIANAIIRRRIEDDLEKARLEAQSASRTKSDFLANISHEIRTPLHGIIGYCEMLAADDFPEQTRTSLDNLQRAAKSLSYLINDVIDISRIEAGVFEIRPEESSLREIVDLALAAVEPLASANGNTLIYRCTEEVPDCLFVDPLRLRQVLVNLLSNAVKFTAKGRVSLLITLEAGQVLFRVEDTGIGMDALQLQSLFEPFVQFDSSIAKRYQGSGLGLTICRHILEQMGARLEVESAPGAGSSFHFVLSLQKMLVDKQPLRLTKPAMPAAVLTGPLKILVVEDNRLNMQLLKSMLVAISPQLSLSTALSGAEAIKLVAEGLQPDLVLMDLQMPEMDGFATTRHLQAQLGSGLKVIALTATATEEIRQRCFDAGMQDFMAKPFSRTQLSQLLVTHSRHD